MPDSDKVQVPTTGDKPGVISVTTRYPAAVSPQPRGPWAVNQCG